jgi:hypothetical protein
MQALDALHAGVTILNPVLHPHGFNFELRGSGSSSGGRFAWGEYVRNERRIELHFRYSLGLVTYHIGDLLFGHEVYLRALGVPAGTHQYPGFSSDPLDGFRHLAHDLERFCGEFVSGDASVFLRASREAAEQSAKSAPIYEKEYTAGAVGDKRKREEARALFREGDYSGVVALLRTLQYPELLRESERRAFQIAQRRSGVQIRRVPWWCCIRRWWQH